MLLYLYAKRLKIGNDPLNLCSLKIANEFLDEAASRLKSWPEVSAEPVTKPPHSWYDRPGNPTNQTRQYRNYRVSDVLLQVIEVLPQDFQLAWKGFTCCLSTAPELLAQFFEDDALCSGHIARIHHGLDRVFLALREGDSNAL